MAERRIRIVLDPRGVESGSRRAKTAVNQVDREVVELKANLRGVIFDPRGNIVSGARRSKRSVESLEDEVDRLKAKLRTLEIPTPRGTGRARSALEGVGAAAGRVAVVLAGLYVGVRAVQEIVRYADAWRLTENRLKVVTTSGQELTAVQTRLLELAARSYSGFQPTVELYSRLSRSTEELNISQSRLLGITRAVNQAILVGGSTAAEAGAGVIQFSQALASSRLSGDELRSVLEQMPRLARALAEGLGVGIGELRRLGEEGELTTERVIRALEESAPGIAREFEQLTPTVGAAFTVLGDSLLAYVGRLDDALGITESFSRATLGLAESLRGLSTPTQTYVSDLAAQLSLEEQILEKEREIIESRNRSVPAGVRPGTSSSAVRRLIEELEELERQDPVRRLVMIQDELAATRSRLDDVVPRSVRAGLAQRVRSLEIEEEAAIRAAEALRALQTPSQIVGDITNRLLPQLAMLEPPDLSIQNEPQVTAQVQRIIDAYQKQAEQVGRTRLEYDLLQAARAGATSGQQAEIRALGERAEADRDALRTAEENRRESERAAVSDERLIESLRLKGDSIRAVSVEARAALITARLSADADDATRETANRLALSIIRLTDSRRDEAEATREANRETRQAQREAAQQQAASDRAIESLRARLQTLSAVTDAEEEALFVRRALAMVTAEEREATRGLAEEVYRLEAATRARIEADRDSERAAEELRRESEALATELASNIGSSFEDAILGARGFGESLAGLGQDIARLIIRITILKPLTDSLVSAFSRGQSGSGGFLGSLLGGLLGGLAPTAATSGAATPIVLPPTNVPGFQAGGSFTVPGSGGPDSSEVFFRATPGERVTVATPGQQQGQTVVQVIDNRTSGASDDGLQVSESRGSDGGRRVRIVIEDSMESGLRSGRFDGAFGSRYGLRPSIAAR